MKKLLASVIGLLLASVIGCSNNADTSGKGLIGLAALTGTGQVSFSFDETNAGPSKSIAGPVNAPAVTALVVTITDAADNIVYNTVSLPVTTLGGQYITQPLILATGSYHLTGFAAVNSIGEALYASPLEGSALAYLISDPLPIDFTITKNQVSKLVPEVLSTASYMAGDFGYGTFNFDIVETIDFLASVIVYNETSSGYELTDAAITVTSDTTTLYTGTLPAAITAVKVRDGYTSYTVTVTKDGYADYTHTFTNAEIKAYAATPLTVTLAASSLPSVYSVTKTFYNATDSSIIGRSLGEWVTDQSAYMSNDTNSINNLTGFSPSEGTYESMNMQLMMSTSTGTDGVWFTDDDTTMFHFDFNSLNNHQEFYSSGSHTSPFSYIVETANLSGYRDMTALYSTGADTIAYTADDTCNMRIYATFEQERITEIKGYLGDTQTITETDVYEYDAYGITKLTTYSDDKVTISYVKTTAYDLAGRAITVNFYSDNEITQVGRATIEYEATGRCSKIIVYNGAGADGVWNTSDDVIGIIPNPINPSNYIGFGDGTSWSIIFESGTLYPVATYEYNQYGFCIRTNCYSDNEQTLQMYYTIEYN